MARLLSLAVLALAISPTLQAEERKDALRIVSGWGADPEICDGSKALFVPLNDLLAETYKYLGQCVKTEGYYRARALFLKRKDTKRKYPSQNEVSADRRLGIYANVEQLEAMEERDGRLLTVIGQLSHCDALKSENVIMIMGYCHYTSGPIIGLVQE